MSDIGGAVSGAGAAACAVHIRPLLEVGEIVPGGMDVVHDDNLVAGIAGIEEVPPLVHSILYIGRGEGPARLVR